VEQLDDVAVGVGAGAHGVERGAVGVDADGDAAGEALGGLALREPYEGVAVVIRQRLLVVVAAAGGGAGVDALAPRQVEEPALDAVVGGVHGVGPRDDVVGGDGALVAEAALAAGLAELAGGALAGAAV